MNFKLVLLLLCVSLSSFTSTHKFYVSVTEVEYNNKSETLQIMSRVFIDDLEDLLQTRYDKSLMLGEKLETPGASKHVKKYLENKFDIHVNGKGIEVNYLGMEYEDDMILLYLETPKIKSIQKISVRNALLTDLFDEQKNLVHVTYKGNTKSLILNKEKQDDLLIFNN